MPMRSMFGGLRAAASAGVDIDAVHRRHQATELQVPSPENPSPEDDATVDALKKELGVRRSSIFANTGNKIGASGYATLRDYIDAVKRQECRYK